jgi:hypothetical protein
MRTHLITSSQMASSGAGLVMPSALAVLSLMTRLLLGRRLHRQVGWLLAFEDAIEIAGHPRVDIEPRRSLWVKGGRVGGGSRPSGLPSIADILLHCREPPQRANNRHSIFSRQRLKLPPSRQLLRLGTWLGVGT